MDDRITTLGKGKYLQLLIRHDQGTPSNAWEYCERVIGSGVVLIVAVTDAKELLLVEQFRPALMAKVLEIPAGLVGDLGDSSLESFADAAKRELLEETGYQATRVQYLTEGPVSSGLTNETVTLFFADGLVRRTAGGGDASENITVHHVPLDQVETFTRKKMKLGVKIDPKIFSALFFATESLRNKP